MMAFQDVTTAAYEFFALGIRWGMRQSRASPFVTALLTAFIAFEAISDPRTRLLMHLVY